MAANIMSDEIAVRRAQKADSELLELIVIIGLSDRLEAMAIRDSDGPAAAIKFIRDTCNLTNEQYTPSVESAKEEIRRQFAQSYALVTSALYQLNALVSEDANKEGELGVARTLLDMAQTEL